VLLVLLGCGLGDVMSGAGTDRSWVDMTPGDLIGVWSNDRGDSIEFTADGEFFADDLKYMFARSGLAVDLDLSQDTASASGRWSLTAPRNNPNGKRSFVELNFDVIANQPTAAGTDLLARQGDGRVELGYNVGDPDLNNVVIYVRCDDNCSHLRPDRPPLGVPTAASRHELSGVWRDQHGAQLVLDADGTYTAEDLRFAYVGAEKLLPYGLSLQDGRLSSEGSWSTTSPEHDPAGPETTISLAIETIAGRPSFGTRPLRIYADDQKLVLATVSSNPEVVEQHVFHKLGI
jgi:hypothetical protein